MSPLDPTLKISFLQKASEFGIHDLKLSPKDSAGAVFQPK
jgi:hypothetical protein